MRNVTHLHARSRQLANWEQHTSAKFVGSAEPVSRLEKSMRVILLPQEFRLRNNWNGFFEMRFFFFFFLFDFWFKREKQIKVFADLSVENTDVKQQQKQLN